MAKGRSRSIHWEPVSAGQEYCYVRETRTGWGWSGELNPGESMRKVLAKFGTNPYQASGRLKCLGDP